MYVIIFVAGFYRLSGLCTAGVDVMMGVYYGSEKVMYTTGVNGTTYIRVF